MSVADRWHKAHPRPGDPQCEHTRADGTFLTPTAAHGEGDRWQARYRDQAGKQRARRFTRKAEAERYVATAAADIPRGAWVDDRAGRVTLEVYAGRWLAAQRPGGSADTNRSRLNVQILPALGSYQLGQLQASVIRPWLAGLSRSLEPNTVRAVYGVLYSILQSAADDELIGRNPCTARTIKPPPKPEVKIVPWTAEQIAGVAGSIGARWNALVLAGAALGLRQGELLGLAADDIDLKRRVVHVRRQLQHPRGKGVFKLPKGDKARDVPLSDRTARLLAAHMLAHPPVAARLPWGTADGKPVTARLLFTFQGRPVRHQYLNTSVWAPALEAAGMSDGKVSMHALRHYAASSWLASGVNIKAVAEYLGHSNAAFTLRVYAHLMPSAADAVRAAMDESLSACARNVHGDAAGGVF